MSFTHRVTTGLGVVGLVVAGLLTSGSGGIPASARNASQTPQNRSGAISRLTPSPSAVPVFGMEDVAASWLAQDAQEAAIAALTAQQAQDLADQLQRAVQRSLQAVPQTPASTVTASSPPGDCYGVNSYAAYIYQHESGCRTEAVNGGGCAGIGQACPGSKMPCSLTDAPCQLGYFEAYALGRYGSWEAAYAFWQSHGWW